MVVNLAKVQAEGSQEIILSLSDRCIEEAAEEKRDEIRSKVDDSKEKGLGQKLDMLDDFLDSADFKELRRLGFNGEKDMRVRVWREDDSFTVVRAFSFG